MNEIRERRIPLRIVDSGQHDDTSRLMFKDLSLPDPDLRLREGGDVATYGQAIRWMGGLFLLLLKSRRQIREEIFADADICVVHGDTPTTLISYLLAKRAGVPFAHLEAGVSSGNWFKPFPEEIVRQIVMRRADLCFALGDEATNYIRRRNRCADVFTMDHNTTYYALPSKVTPTLGDNQASPYAVVTCHRVETIRRKDLCEALVNVIEHASHTTEVRFFMHKPTRRAFERHNLIKKLESMHNVHLLDLLPHSEFVHQLEGAKFVITDGGSIHEESALLGKATVVWRDVSEIQMGFGDNVILSSFDTYKTKNFIDEADLHAREPVTISSHMIEEIVDKLNSFTLER